MRISIFQYATKKLPERTTAILRHQVEVVKSSKSYLTATTGKPLIDKKIVEFLKELYHEGIEIDLICQEIVKLAHEAGLITEPVISQLKTLLINSLSSS